MGKKSELKSYLKINEKSQVIESKSNFINKKLDIR